MFRRIWRGLGAVLPQVTTTATAAAAIGALWFTGQSLQSTQRQVAITEQGQYTDRYTKAVEQLGSQQIDVRLGGIYALERLAFDSTQDTRTIAEVLPAFVRNRLPLKDCSAPPPGSLPQPLPPDLQAAVTVHERLKNFDPSLGGIDLSRTCLAGVDLSHSDLEYGRFDHSDLRRASLTYANLESANLNSADLTGADLSPTNLSKAHLTGAKLSGAKLSGSAIYNANLSDTDLSNSDLSQVGLNNSDMTDANLTGADLTDADLTHAGLDDANLTGAVLTGARGLR